MFSPSIFPETPFCDAFPPRLTYPGFPRLSYYGGLLASLGIEGNQEGGVGFHSWRVSFVTRMRGDGVTDQVIRGIVGHASEEMVDLYSHDTSAAVRAMRMMESSCNSSAIDKAYCREQKKAPSKGASEVKTSRKSGIRSGT